MTSKMLTKKQVAESFQVCERTINRWVSEQKLKPFRKGNIVRFDPAEIERFKRKYAA